MLNLGIRGHDISCQSPLELVEKVQQYGFSNIQLAPKKSFPVMFSSQNSLSVGAGQWFQRLFKQYNISISVLGCYVNIASQDDTIRGRALDDFKKHIRLAHSFNCPIVGTETGSVEKGYTVKNFTEEAYQIIVDSIKELVTEAEKWGVIVGIEAGINHPLYNIQLVQRLLKDISSSHLQIILDCTNLLTIDNYKHQDQIMEEAFEKLGDRIIHIHLKDYQIVDNELVPAPVGQGIMNFIPILKYIKYDNPYINATMEATVKPYIEPSKEYLLKLYDMI